MKKRQSIIETCLGSSSALKTVLSSSTKTQIFGVVFVALILETRVTAEKFFFGLLQHQNKDHILVEEASKYFIWVKILGVSSLEQVLKFT